LSRKIELENHPISEYTQIFFGCFLSNLEDTKNTSNSFQVYFRQNIFWLFAKKNFVAGSFSNVLRRLCLELQNINVVLAIYSPMNGSEAQENLLLRNISLKTAKKNFICMLNVISYRVDKIKHWYNTKSNVPRHSGSSRLY
jgi:hypothetical protein